MRRFDGQSPLEAYQESVQSIRSNALSAASKLAQRIRLYFRKDELPGVSRVDFLKTLRDGTGP